jgi:hypothetical protein
VTPVELERFLSKVEEVDCGLGSRCWVWTGATDGKPEGLAYGQVRLRGRTRRAHRVSFEHFVGPIPPEHDLDHRCRTRLCVNHAHLEPCMPPELVDVIAERVAQLILERQTPAVAVSPYLMP